MSFMEPLEKLLIQKARKIDIKPVFFDLERADHRVRLHGLLQKNTTIHVVDELRQQLEELFLSRNPKLKRNPELAKKEVTEFLKSSTKKYPLERQGRWVYFSWNSSLVHILDEPDFFELRTSRNRNLITKEEQTILKSFRIGLMGLSVGNSAALALGLEGFETMRLADFDEISLSNLNRIRGSVTQLGLNKTIMTARQMYELNPYAKLELFPEGINGEKLVQKFVAGPPKLGVLIDETDDVIMKIQLRIFARKLRVPVISVADNGDNAIADVDRFDLEPNRPLYHGLLADEEIQNIAQINLTRKMQLISAMVGPEYVTSRMKRSFLEVGKTLYSWPQLGGAAMLSGATIAYLVKKLALNEKLPSGKYDVNLDRIFDSRYDSPETKKARVQETQEFLAEQKRIFSSP